MWEGQTLLISVLNPSLSLSFSLSPTPRWLPLSHPYPRRLKTPFMVETHFFHYHLPLFSQINAMATFMPALSSFSSMGTIQVAGPKMQTILVFGGFRFWNLYGYVCMFVFYEMVHLCSVMCAKIHAHVNVITMNRRDGLRWEREEWIVLNGLRIKLSFKDQVGRFLKVLDLIGINPNLRGV